MPFYNPDFGNGALIVIFLCTNFLVDFSLTFMNNHQWTLGLTLPHLQCIIVTEMEITYNFSCFLSLWFQILSSIGFWPVRDKLYACSEWNKIWVLCEAFDVAILFLVSSAAHTPALNVPLHLPKFVKSDAYHRFTVRHFCYQGHFYPFLQQQQHHHWTRLSLLHFSFCPIYICAFFLLCPQTRCFHYQFCSKYSLSRRMILRKSTFCCYVRQGWK